MLQKIGKLNDVSQELLDSIPALENDDIATFEMLDFSTIEDAENGESKIFYPKVQIPTRDRIYDPYKKAYIFIGVPKTTDGEKVESFKTLLPGSELESTALFGGKFSLSGSKFEDREMYYYLMLSNFNNDNPHRDKNITPLFKRLDFVSIAKKSVKQNNCLLSCLNLINDMSLSEMREISRSLNWTDINDKDVLTSLLQAEAIRDAEWFSKMLVDDSRKIKANIKQAEIHQIIHYVPNLCKVLWTKGNKVIGQLDKDDVESNWVDQFADWIKTHQNGDTVYSQIKKQIAAKIKTEVEA